MWGKPVNEALIAAPQIAPADDLPGSACRASRQHNVTAVLDDREHHACRAGEPPRVIGLDRQRIECRRRQLPAINSPRC